MPLNLGPADRKLVLGAGITFLLLLVVSLLVTRSQESRVEIPTTYSVSSSGAKAAYMLLAQLGYRQQRWQKPLSDLPDPDHHVLILAEPSGLPTSAQKARLLQFVEAGGRLILTGFNSALFLPDSDVQPQVVPATTWKKASSLAPSSITRAAPSITLAETSSWEGNHRVLPLYADDGKVVVVKYAMGKGEVLWWASATPLSNAGLKEPGNLEFLLACLGSREHTQILWDEYFHGYREPEPLESWRRPLQWFYLQLAVLGLAVLLTFSRRSGPICVPAGEVRLSPLEFVRTLGGLYERAHATSVAVDVCYQRFRYWLTRRLGVAGNTSVDDLNRAVAERWRFTDSEFAAVLRECESARYYTELPKSRALHLVRALYDYTARLKLSPVASKEKADGSSTPAGGSHKK